MTRNLTVAIVLAIAAGSAAHAQSIPWIKLISQKHDDPSRAIGVGPPRISAEGFTIAYASTDSDLVPDDGFVGPDVFVHDLACKRTLLISKTWNGDPANGSSGTGDENRVSVSGDGRYVAFVSVATNLVDDGVPDTPSTNDIFLVDRTKAYGTGTGRVRRISVDMNGAEPNNYSYDPTVSADGRWVAFASHATNLVANDTGASDIFVYSIDPPAPGQPRIVKASFAFHGGNPSNHSHLPQISADGTRIVFRSIAGDLISPAPHTGWHAYVRTNNSGNILASRNDQDLVATHGTNGQSAISGDGSAVAFPSAGGNMPHGPASHVYLRKLATDETLPILAGPDTVPTKQPSLNHNGNYVAFASEAPGHVYRQKIDNSAQVLVSQGYSGAVENGTSDYPSINASGARVAFRSTSTNLTQNPLNSGATIAAAYVAQLDPDPSQSRPRCTLDLLIP